MAQALLYEQKSGKECNQNNFSGVKDIVLGLRLCLAHSESYFDSPVLHMVPCALQGMISDNRSKSKAWELALIVAHLTLTPPKDNVYIISILYKYTIIYKHFLNFNSAPDELFSVLNCTSRFCYYAYILLKVYLLICHRYYCFSFIYIIIV